MTRLLLCLTALVVLSGCGNVTAQREPPEARTPWSPAASAPSATPTPGTPHIVTREAVPPTVPTRLRLGAIDARVVPIELTGSTLTPPDDPRVIGWWGKRTGSPRGTTLLTGHTVHNGGGAFHDLEDTRRGARAQLSGHTYQVTSVEVISKDDLARQATALFAQRGRPKLVLVTCEDYNRATGHYASNVVVILHPVE